MLVAKLQAKTTLWQFNIAMENGHRKSCFFQLKIVISTIAIYASHYQREISLSIGADLDDGTFRYMRNESSANCRFSRFFLNQHCLEQDGHI